jgi:hypothetical protein
MRQASVVLALLAGFAGPLVQDALAQEKPLMPFRVQIVYSPLYAIDLGGLEKLHPFDIRKYEKIYKQLLLDRKISDQHALIPEPLTRDQLLLIHTEPYLQSLKVRGKRPSKSESASILVGTTITRNRIQARGSASLPISPSRFVNCRRKGRSNEPSSLIPLLLAEMRKQPGGSDQHIAMFTSRQTGRLAPNRY